MVASMRVFVAVLVLFFAMAAQSFAEEARPVTREEMATLYKTANAKFDEAVIRMDKTMGLARTIIDGLQNGQGSLFAREGIRDWSAEHDKTVDVIIEALEAAKAHNVRGALNRQRCLKDGTAPGYDCITLHFQDSVLTTSVSTMNDFMFNANRIAEGFIALFH